MPAKDFSAPTTCAIWSLTVQPGHSVWISKSSSRQRVPEVDDRLHGVVERVDQSVAVVGGGRVHGHVIRLLTLEACQPCRETARPVRGPARPLSGVADVSAMVVAGVVAVGLRGERRRRSLHRRGRRHAGRPTDAGPVVRWALPLVRVVHDVAASLDDRLAAARRDDDPGPHACRERRPRRAAPRRRACASRRRQPSSGRSREPSGSSSRSPTPRVCRSVTRSFGQQPHRVGRGPSRRSASALISAVAAFVVASVAARGARPAPWRVALTVALGVRPARPRPRRPRRRLGRPRDGGQRARRAPAERGRLGRRAARRSSSCAGPLGDVARRRGPALLDRRPLVLRHPRRLRRHVGDDPARLVVRPRHAVRRPRPRQGARLRGPRCRRRRGTAG